MWQFIISGYVPGTEIQVSFEVFLMSCMLFALTAYLAVQVMKLLGNTQSAQTNNTESIEAITI